MNIKPLERVIESDVNDIQVSRPPSNAEIMNKLNEVIRVVNSLKVDMERIKFETAPNPFKSRSY